MRIILYIGIAIIALSCGQIPSDLQSGDLLFQVGKMSDMTGAISTATGKNEALNFSHIGIVIVTNGVDSVLEASTECGVRIVALEEFLSCATRIDDRPAVVALRLKDTSGVAQAVARARQFTGQPYDFAYLPDNGKIYCSELVWESYLAPDGSHLFQAQPMNFRAADGSMPAFWTELFAQLDMPVPEGVPGTNPNHMSKETILETVCRYF